jgi:hypothetical protein
MRSPRRLPAPDLDAGTAVRSARWAESTTRRVWPDVSLVVLALVLVGMLVPALWRGVYHAVLDRTTPPPAIQPWSCGEPPERADLLPAFPASFVCDGQLNTAWVTPLDPRYTPPQLIITLVDPKSATPVPGLDVAVFRITAAVPPPEYAVRDTGRPAQVRLDFYATDQVQGAHPVRSITVPTGPDRTHLQDSSAAQSIPIEPCLAGIRVVVVTVLAAYPDPTTHGTAQNVFVNKVGLTGPRSPCNRA